MKIMWVQIPPRISSFISFNNKFYTTNFDMKEPVKDFKNKYYKK